MWAQSDKFWNTFAAIFLAVVLAGALVFEVMEIGFLSFFYFVAIAGLFVASKPLTIAHYERILERSDQIRAELETKI